MSKKKKIEIIISIQISDEELQKCTQDRSALPHISISVGGREEGPPGFCKISF
jgi:hypothetical protein